MNNVSCSKTKAVIHVDRINIYFFRCKKTNQGKIMQKQVKIRSIKIIKNALLILSLLLEGCASTSVLTKVEPPSDKAGVVYIIRQHAEPLAFHMNIYHNDINIAKLANLSHVSFNLPVGRNKLLFKFPALALSMQPEGNLELEVEPNSTRYFVVGSRYQIGNSSVNIPLSLVSGRIIDPIPTITQASGIGVKELEQDTALELI